MKKISWNAPYLDRKVWLLEHLETLHLDAKEALVLLLIDHFNTIHVNIHHELLATKLKINEEEVEDIFNALAEKGYLNLDFKDGNMVFDISGVYALENTSEVNYAKSLLEEFENEFKRSLSPSEMDRILNLASIYSERMVIVALNEAASYDKRDLNYIERILISWTDKGLSVEDVENGKR